MFCSAQTAEALGHDLREILILSGELNPREAESIEWDVIVVGTGMGGGTLGYSLARSGRRVLFVEKGRSTLPGTPGTIRSAMPGTGRTAGVPFRGHLPRRPGPRRTLDRRGRRHQRPLPEAVHAAHRQRDGGLVGSLRHGLRAVLRRDFTPRQNFRNPGDSTVPDAWPVTYDEMRPWYAAAERLLGVRGQPDPLRPEAADAICLRRHLFRPTTSRWSTIWPARGLHPYHLPMACDYTDGCATCQTAISATESCKNDAARNCVLPAVAEHGAHLLTECRVVRLEADRTQVQQVICEHRSGTLALKAKVVVLAAGALVTPMLLLNSRSDDWPRGLANGSDWVGRNLMRHLIDLIEIWPQRDSKITGENKEIGLNDFYFWEGQKYGTVQSFGAMPPMEALTNHPGWQLEALRLMSPAARPIYERFFSGGLQSCSDAGRPALSGQPRTAMRPTQLGRPPAAATSVSLSRQRNRTSHNVFAAPERGIRAVSQPQGAGAKDNTVLGHVCGTCRFGIDPKTSVLDRYNRAHEVDNLYVVDASFFPSSTGMNPSLTVAANALRVAEHVNQTHFAD